MKRILLTLMLLTSCTVSKSPAQRDIENMSSVNNEINNYHYVSDQEQFGVVDYWQKPVDFLKRGKGDCEDFALAKAYLLDKRGLINPARIEVWALTSKTAGGKNHLVIIVDLYYVLDNNYTDVYPVNNLLKYYNIFAVMNYEAFKKVTYDKI